MRPHALLKCFLVHVHLALPGGASTSESAAAGGVSAIAIPDKNPVASGVAPPPPAGVAPPPPAAVASTVHGDFTPIPVPSLHSVIPQPHPSISMVSEATIGFQMKLEK